MDCIIIVYVFVLICGYVMMCSGLIMLFLLFLSLLPFLSATSYTYHELVDHFYSIPINRTHQHDLIDSLQKMVASYAFLDLSMDSTKGRSILHS